MIHFYSYVLIKSTTRSDARQKSKRGRELSIPIIRTELHKAQLPVVGSSANMTDGLAISSHARDRRFFSPPLIPRTFASPTLESAQLTLKNRIKATTTKKF